MRIGACVSSRSFGSNVIPSIFGIMMSRTITSGSKRLYEVQRRTTVGGRLDLIAFARKPQLEHFANHAVVVDHGDTSVEHTEHFYGISSRLPLKGN